MSERHLKNHPRSPEIQPSQESKEQQKNPQETLQELREQSPNERESVKNLGLKAEQQAMRGHEISVGETEKPVHDLSYRDHKDLKKQAYQRTLSRVQSQLATPDRILSKIVHHPAVDRVSAIGAQTVARPSGIIGGGLAALAGSSFVLFYSRTYGFSYNYLLFVLLFVGGFTLGLVVELLGKLLHRSKG